MDTQMSKWIIEFIIRQRVDDSLLDRLLARLPLEDVDYRLKRGLLIRRIQTEVSKGLVSEKILDLLELVGELDFSEGKFPSESMRTAYCAVALDCTVRFLEMEDNRMYFETLQRIWRGRIRKMGNSENCGLITEKLWGWRDDLEAASTNVEICDKILSRNTRYEALKAVKAYLVESWNEMGPSFLEKTAENVYNMGKAGQGINALGEEQGFEGLENVTEAGKVDNALEKEQGLENVTEAGNEDNVLEKGQGSESLENVTEVGEGDNVVLEKEQGFEGLKNVTEAGEGDHVLEKEQGLENVVEAHNGITPSDRPSAETHGFEGLENVTEAGMGDNVLEKEEGLEGLENVTEAHDGITPSAMPSAETQHKQGPPRRKHVGVRRKILYGRGSKAKISNNEEVDKDTSKNEYHCFPSPEVNQMRADLESSFADLNAVVRDPLPEALKIAEGVSSDVQRDTVVGGNHGTEMNVDSIPTDKRDRAGANSVENIRGDGHPEREERGNENQTMTSDPLEFTQDSSSPSRPHLQSPKRRRITPLKTYRITKVEKRRLPRKWSVLEEDTLRKGVQEFGRGNWKAILMEYRDILEERTEVDLKDKWRNLTRYSR